MPPQTKGSSEGDRVNKIAEALNSHCKSLNGARVLVAGIADKRDIDDIHESPPMLSARAWPGGVELRRRR